MKLCETFVVTYVESIVLMMNSGFKDKKQGLTTICYGFGLILKRKTGGKVCF